jgi:putative PIN family toxin of toxin-antitoxin system
VTRIVLDTNVLVSGLLSASGPPAWILEAIILGDIELAFDMAIREEYEEVLRRPEFAFPPERIDALLSVIDRFGVLVAAAPRLATPLPDDDDEPFLAVASCTGAVLVTGNVRHFPARARAGVKVQTPRECQEALRRR